MPRPTLPSTSDTTDGAADAFAPMPDPLRHTAARWLAAGRPAVLVQVLQARGSVPRGTGTRMLVAADTLAGTIGGGHLEWRAMAAARALLAPAPHAGRPGADRAPAARAAADPVEAADGTATTGTIDVTRSAGDAMPPPDADGWRRLPLALGPSLGQCCGGALTLGLRPLDATALAAWPDRERPRLRLQLHGAGHVGAALARLLHTLPLAVQWVDERPDAFTRGPAADWLQELQAPRATDPAADAGTVQPLGTDDAVAEVAAAPPGCCYLVMTHDHGLDERLVEAVLRRGDARWLGLIGSASKRARFEHRLQGRGLDTSALVCPIGLAGIAGKEPAVIAVAVAAQLLALPPD